MESGSPLASDRALSVLCAWAKWARRALALWVLWACEASPGVEAVDAGAGAASAPLDEPPRWDHPPGVDELDVMKSDGKTLFVVRDDRLLVFAASTLTPMADVTLGVTQTALVNVGTRLVVVGLRCDGGTLPAGKPCDAPRHPPQTLVLVIETRARAQPERVDEHAFEGAWRGARVVGGVVWLALQRRGSRASDPGDTTLVAVDVTAARPAWHAQTVEGPPRAVVFDSTSADVATGTRSTPTLSEATQIRRFGLTPSPAHAVRLGSRTLGSRLAGRGALQPYRRGLVVVSRRGPGGGAESVQVTQLDDHLEVVGVAELGTMPAGPIETRLVDDALFVGPSRGDVRIIVLSPSGPRSAGTLRLEGECLSMWALPPTALLTAHLLASADGIKPGIALRALDLSDARRPRLLGGTVIGLGALAPIPTAADLLFWRPEGLVGVPVNARLAGHDVAGLALSRLSLAQGFMPLGRLDHEAAAGLEGARVLRAAVFGESLYVLSTSGVSSHALTDLRRDAYADLP